MASASDIASSANMRPVELTLIVAATRSMGIGRAGALPWTGLKNEMAYFARVTKRVNTILSDDVEHVVRVFPPPNGDLFDKLQPATNAVIMGRKTWESIPERFRPLKGRLNVVLSRSFPPDVSVTPMNEKEPVRLSSLDAALKNLSEDKFVNRCFVIGGAEIYKVALERKETKRVLLTRVLTDFGCDTIFPVALGEDTEGEWRRKSKEELDRWVGEEVPDGAQNENGVKYVFEMYERP